MLTRLRACFRSPKFRHLHPAGGGQFGSFGIPLVFELPILAIAVLKLGKKYINNLNILEGYS